MTKILDIIKKINWFLVTEPVAVGAVVASVVALLAGFGWVVSLSATQVGTVMAFLAAITGLIVRSKVTPVADPVIVDPVPPIVPAPPVPVTDGLGNPPVPPKLP